ncbi:MAG: helix-turn-helix domain-containing protein [Anaerolineales bacterium]|nr:helix-turn-helix domain-containing protein [Anaerolineales bacterium]
MGNEWLSLSEAAEIIGVHPSTVRSWADRGLLPVQRTQGKHRRFHREDIQTWIRSKNNPQVIEVGSVMQNAVRSTRTQIVGGALEKQSWYNKLDEEARNQYRLSGRSLMVGLMNHLSAPDEEDQSMNAEARSLGYEYASRGQRCGLSSAEAAHAFLFFRNNLLESILNGYETAGVRSPRAWAEMYRKANHFTDLILITLLETYESGTRAGH